MLLNRTKISNSIDQSAKYSARFFIKELGNNKNVIGISSSYDNKKLKFLICKKICQEILNYEKTVFLFDADYMLEKTENFETRYLSSSLFDEVIKNEIIVKKSKSDVVILNIPCITNNVVSLDYLSICDEIFLAERYMYTKYDELNSTIKKLQMNDLKISGIISYS